MDKNGLLETITAHRTGGDLDEVLRKDKDYQEALAQSMAQRRTALEWGMGSGFEWRWKKLCAFRGSDTLFCLIYIH